MAFYGVELSSRLLLGTARYPSPKVLADAIKASEAEVVTVSLRREAGSGAQRAGLLVDHPRARRARAAQHGGLPQREGGGDDRAHGARAVRHAVDQARGHPRRRDPAARRVRPGRGGEGAERGRLRGLSLHDRGSRRGRPAGRGRLQGADAVGRADRLGARPEQRSTGSRRCARISPIFRWWSMPGSACRRMPRRRWSWATTPCCSTRRWPKRAIPSRWPRPSPWRSRPAAWRSPRGRSSRATWRRRRRRCSARRRLGD